MNSRKRLRLLLLILLLETALLVVMYSASLLKFNLAARGALKSMAKQAKSFVVLDRFSFQNQGSLKNWEEKVFKGKTFYQVFTDSNQSFLNSASNNASSGLYVRIDREAKPGLYLSWRWKAITFPQKKEPQKLSNKGEDDFAARIYVIFPGSTFFSSNVIEYIWDERLPKGTVANSPYSDRIKLFVISSGKGPEEEGGWRTEERNIYEDYLRLFGKEPKRPIGAVALMSDSDNTGTKSEANFGDIVFKVKPQASDANRSVKQETMKSEVKG